MVQPYNIRTIQASVRGAAQYVQDEKIKISRRTIRTLQSIGEWPDEYNSFVGSETKNNLYKDPEKFFRIMHFKPKWYGRRFIFRPLSDSSEKIKEAVQFALEIINRQTPRYIAAPNVSKKPNVSTGAYGGSFKVAINQDGTGGIGGLRVIQSAAQLDNMGPRSSVGIYNVAPYASTAERNALYYARVYGIIYYAAQMVQRRYPDLGVRFTYPKAADLPGALAKYNTPLLQIGTRETVIDKITKPGKNLRRRQRLARSRR